MNEMDKKLQKIIDGIVIRDDVYREPDPNEFVEFIVDKNNRPKIKGLNKIKMSWICFENLSEEQKYFLIREGFIKVDTDIFLEIYYFERAIPGKPYILKNTGFKYTEHGSILNYKIPPNATILKLEEKFVVSLTKKELIVLQNGIADWAESKSAGISIENNKRLKSTIFSAN